MKNYFKKRRFVCTKTLTMNNGEIAFFKHKVYPLTWDGDHRIELLNEQKQNHTVTSEYEAWKQYFIEIQPK